MHASETSATTTPLTGLTLGPVALRTARPERLVPFYEKVLGLKAGPQTQEGITLSAGSRPVVTLIPWDDAKAPPAGAPGLFHLAMRVPDRAALAQRLAAIRGTGLRLGASDHLVSEALYIDDPDGNGIEIYRDRPRAEWPYMPDGSIAMETRPLDLPRLVREEGTSESPSPEGTDMGHVHLKVADLQEAYRFWVETVGLQLMARYPGALFVSADGYHHHLGLNIWQSAGGRAPASDTSGLDHFTMVLPEAQAELLARRLAAAGVPLIRSAGKLRFSDPSGNAAEIVVAG